MAYWEAIGACTGKADSTNCPKCVEDVSIGNLRMLILSGFNPSYLMLDAPAGGSE